MPKGLTPNDVGQGPINRRLNNKMDHPTKSLNNGKSSANCDETFTKYTFESPKFLH